MNRANNFDSVRLLAACMVLFSHCFALYGIENHHNNIALEFVFKLGGIGVGTFFIISGFLITGSFMTRSGPIEFIRNRLLRIYPGLIGIVIFTIIIVGPINTSLSLKEYFTNKETYKYFVNSLLPLEGNNQLPGVFQINASHITNGSLWTIRIEILMYLVILLLGIFKLLTFNSVIRVTAITGALYILTILKISPLPEFLQPSGYNEYALRNMLFFCTGSLFFFSKKLQPTRLFIIISIVTLMLAIETMAFRYLLILLLPPIVIGVALTPPPKIIAKINKYGDFSYGVYLYGFVIQQTLINFLKGKILLSQYIGLSFCLTFVAAYLSWHLLEKRALFYKKK